MDSRGLLNGPWADQYNSWRLSATRLFQQTYYHRPRSRPLRAILTTATCLFLIFLLLHSFHEPSVNYWLKYPSYHPFNEKPEDASIVSPKLAINRNDTLPNNLQKTNPSFHLVVPVTRKSSALCRTLTSAMILNYPPPTLVRYGRQLPQGSAKYDFMVDRITGIYNFLEYTPRLQDHDIVLIVDGFDVYFQLPPEVLIKRFQDLLRENNAKLKKKYGMVTVERPFRKEGVETLQKYSQRVIFSASKECIPNLPEDAGCVTVPQSTLPPDAYGWKTDTHPQGLLTRPRWLKPGAVIGQVADLKLIYAQVLRFVEEHRNDHGDYVALTQMYGRQEYVRELERQRTSNGFMEMLYRWVGISEASNMTGVNPTLNAGQRYEYGIGVDFESRLFFNAFKSEGDVEWLEYKNITKTSSVQMEHHVPRERRLLLPDDLTEDNIDSPFRQPKFNKHEYVNPPWNDTLDKLPNNRSWNSIPLMTNVHSASLPVLVHMNMQKKSGVRDAWWSKMWYQPWARALLRKYMRAQTGFDAAQTALLGGQNYWDLRGGAGGIWTDKGEWMDYPDVCAGFERDVFDDELGLWGEEGGDDFGGPVYNQFGNLIKGKEEF